MATQPQFPTTGTMEGDIAAGLISSSGVYNPAGTPPAGGTGDQPVIPAPDVSGDGLNSLNLDMPSLDQFNANDLLKAVASPITAEDTRKMVSDLRASQLRIAELLQPSAREKEIQGKINTLQSGFENDVTTLQYRPGIDFFTFGRGVSQNERETNLRLAPLQRELGTEVAGRTAAIKGEEALSQGTRDLLNFAQQQEQLAISKFTAISNVVNQLQDNARSVLDTITTQFAGLTYNELDQTTRRKLDLLARNVGLPGSVLRAGMDAVATKLKAENARKDAEFKATQDQRAFDNSIALERLGIDRAKLAQDGLGGMDIANLTAYAQQYAATGKIPTGLPKGSFGYISEIAKALPKQPGTIVDKNTGVKPDVSDTKIDSYAAAYDIVNKVKLAQEKFNKLNTGLVGGTLGNIRPTADRQIYNDLRKEISDLLARLRTGAVINAEEEKRYNGLLPGVYNRTFFLGSSGEQKLKNLESQLKGTLKTRLDAQGVEIVGFDQNQELLNKAAQFDDNFIGQ